jgi:hypothetical protein
MSVFTLTISYTLNLRRQAGKTALDLAIATDDSQLVTLLLDNEADPNIEDPNIKDRVGHSSITIPWDSRHSSFVRKLLLHCVLRFIEADQLRFVLC